MEFAYFLAAAFFMQIAAVLVGFGSSTILTPIAAFVFPIREAIFLVAVFHALGMTLQSIAFGRAINWRIAALFGLPAMAMAALGARFASVLPSALVAKALGWFLVVWAITSFLNDRIRLPRQPLALGGAGLASGFIAGLIGTGGAIRASILTTLGLARESYLGTSAIIAVFVDMTRIPIYFTSGFGHIRLPQLAAMIIVAFASVMIGRRMVGKIPPAFFRKIVIVAVFLAGLRFIMV